MTDELLDLVNENDEVVGEVWKSKANTDPKLIHREVSIIIYDDSGNVLFQKRSKNKKVNPGMWTLSVAGHVNKGEESEKAAHRELFEELGFDTELVFIEKKFEVESNETHFEYLFTGKFLKGTKLELQKEEVDKVAFLSPVKLQQLAGSGEILDKGSEVKVKEFWRHSSQNAL